MDLKEIDINADLGEGGAIDAQIMPLISSCNIACGGHFGNNSTIRTTIRLAKQHGVKVGAHPAFPDGENFGRKVLNITKGELSDTIFEQLSRFLAICESEGIQPHHIKLHGALYNEAAVNRTLAMDVIKSIQRTKRELPLYVPFNSELAKAAENELPLVFEAFIDRRYNDDMSLVARSINGAIITSPKEAWEQFYNMITKQQLTTIQNNKRQITASTYCVHSDTYGAVEILQYIKKKLNELLSDLDHE